MHLEVGSLSSVQGIFGRGSSGGNKRAVEQMGQQGNNFPRRGGEGRLFFTPLEKCGNLEHFHFHRPPPPHPLVSSPNLEWIQHLIKREAGAPVMSEGGEENL